MALESVVLHLGAHKTGTSLVQKYTRRTAPLCRLARIWPVRRSDAQRFISWGQRERTRAGTDGLRAQIARAEAQFCRHVLVSHENALGRPFREGAAHLYPKARKRARNLREMIGDRPVRVVYYIRNQPDFVESYYLQTVHQGQFRDFAAFRAAFAPADALSWRPLYRALCEAFGAENVVIRQFEDEIAAGQSAYLRGFFTAAFGKSPRLLGRYSYDKVHNPSIGDRGLELALEFNRHLRTPAERKLMRRFLQGHFSNRDYPRPHLLDPAEKQALTRRYAAENARIIAAARQAVEAR